MVTGAGLLRTETTMTIWQVGFFKIPMVTGGILMGTYFHEFWRTGLIWLWLVFVLTAILLLPMGIGTVRRYRQSSDGDRR